MLRHESLEHRQLLAGDVLTFNAVPGSPTTLSHDGTQPQIEYTDDQGAPQVVLLSGFESIVFEGSAADDELIVDFRGGNPVPAGGIVFNGGMQGAGEGDTLTILGSFTDQELNYTDVGATGKNGNVVVDGTVITYTGLEPINAGNAANTILNLPVGLSNNATLQNSANAGEIEIIDNGATFEDTVIPNPTVSLTVNLGDQGDVLFVNELDLAYSATTTVNGGALGDLVDAGSNTNGLTILGNGGDDVLIGSSAVDTINGGDDSDILVGGLGADIQFGDAGDDLFIWNNGDGPDDNTGGQDEDTFRFNGADGADDVLILGPGAGDGSLVGADFNLQRTAPSAFFIEGATIENVELNGLDGDDDITVTPSATLNVSVDGGAENTADVLHIDAAGADVTFTPTTVTVAGNNPVTYTNIEELDIQNAGQTEIVGDAGNNVLEVTGNGADDDLSVTLDGMSFTLNTSALSFQGLDGDDVLVINETAGGLPSLTGTASDAHTNDPFDTSGLGPANVGIHFDGGGQNDSVIANFTTAQDVAYFSDLVDDLNSGVVNVSGVLTLSFAGLAPIGLFGAGGSLTVDATGTPATTVLTLADLAPAGDGVNQITGDGGFETTTFSGFANLTLRGGDGAETITLASLDDADPDGAGPGVALTNVALDGDNTAGTDLSNDTILVEAVPSTVTATITGGAGNDDIQVGSAGGSLDPILGNVIVAGEENDAAPSTDVNVTANGNTVTFSEADGDRLYLQDGGDADAATWNIDDGSVMRSGAGTITYSSIETLWVDTGSGNDDINVLDTTDMSITDIFDLGGDNDIDVTTTGAGSLLLVAMIGGNNAVDIASTGADSVTIVSADSGSDDLTLQSSGEGSGVELDGGDGGDNIIINGTGGNGSVVVVQGNEGSDVINVNASAADSFTDVFGGGDDDAINIDGSDP
ncbi:MAG: beta strand repeat-containing protein, partial [Rhodopirellula sp. JB044]|uniref:beta strand repeat-containing protein n=1 Tax=Rhodopirellula sp. JB044 TaxID=3342844 RepID=UPI00370B9785